MEIKFKSKLWIWKGEAPASWYFITLPAEYYNDLKSFSSSRTKTGFGSIRVEATIGKSTWKTSIFPSKELGSYLLPIKKIVRTSESLKADDLVSLKIKILEG